MNLTPFVAVIFASALLGSPAVCAATYSLDSNQSSLAYSFLSGWAMRTIDPAYETYLPPANTGSSNHHMAAFIQFDLAPLIGSSVSSGDVTDAKVRLYVLDPSSIGFGGGPSESYPVSVDFRLLTAAWDESTLTWNNQPGGSYNPTTTVPPGQLVGSISGIDGSGFWVELDITQVLKGWLDDPSTNFGFRITENAEVRDTGGTAIFPSFASEGYSDPSVRPEIVVNTVPEPSVAGCIVFAGLATSLRRRR